MIRHGWIGLTSKSHATSEVKTPAASNVIGVIRSACFKQQYHFPEEGEHCLHVASSSVMHTIGKAVVAFIYMEAKAKYARDWAGATRPYLAHARVLQYPRERYPTVDVVKLIHL